MGYSIEKIVGFVCQRIPFLMHVMILIVAIYGPNSSPLFYSIIYLLVHLIMLITSIEMFWGTYSAWKGIENSCKTDWYSLCERESFYSNLNVTDYSLICFNMIEHIILIPCYNESIITLRTTLDILQSHKHAKTSYRICLAMEEREIESKNKAESLIDKYNESFVEMCYSIHPSNIQGEMAGKSSNINWAARYMYDKYKSNNRHHCQIVTVVDSDTALAQDYFDCVTARYCMAKYTDRAQMMFVTPIVFDRNAHKVPVIIRVADMIWSVAEISTIYPRSFVKIPASVYSLSMNLVILVDFWDVGPEAIGEDLHMLTKCFLTTGGHLKMETIYSPASQLNVISENHGKGLFGYWTDLKARYAQAVRHMWGALDVGYAVRRIITGNIGELIIRNHFDMTNQTNNNYEHSTNQSNTILEVESNQSQSFLSSSVEESLISNNDNDFLNCSSESMQNRKIKFFRIFILLARLFQAHIMPGWIFILMSIRQFNPISTNINDFLLTDSDIHRLSNVSNNVTVGLNTQLPQMIPAAMWIVFFVKFAQLVSYGVVLFTLPACLIYFKVHYAAAVRRWDTNLNTNLGLRPKEISIHRMPYFLLNVLALPPSMIFLMIASLHAIGLHLFTRWLVYTVSFKTISSINNYEPISSV